MFGKLNPFENNILLGTATFLSFVLMVTAYTGIFDASKETKGNTDNSQLPRGVSKLVISN